MQIERIHHVALRCTDARASAGFYQRVLGMDLLGAVADDIVPSTRDADPYVSVLMDAGGGAILAFFEVPGWPRMQADPNTPTWVQHVALQVATMDELLQAKQRAVNEGLEVIGPVDHTIFHSVYFFDPDGHRIEVAVPTEQATDMSRLKESAQQVLDDWQRNKGAPRGASWLHAREMSQQREAS